MPEGRLAVGEVVQLKSGGPRMTVESIIGDEVTCVWFAEMKQTHGTFPAATLVRWRDETRGGSHSIYSG